MGSKKLGARAAKKKRSAARRAATHLHAAVDDLVLVEKLVGNLLFEELGVGA